MPHSTSFLYKSSSFPTTVDIIFRITILLFPNIRILFSDGICSNIWYCIWIKCANNISTNDLLKFNSKTKPYCPAFFNTIFSIENLINKLPNIRSVYDLFGRFSTFPKVSSKYIVSISFRWTILCWMSNCFITWWFIATIINKYYCLAVFEFSVNIVKFNFSCVTCLNPDIIWPLDIAPLI